MAFDPDAFLAQQSAPKQLFDPDAFLAAGVEEAQEPPQEEPKPTVQEEQSVFREIADVPLKLAGGVTTGVRLIADALGADNAISQNLRGVEDWIGALYSAQSKQDSQEIARIMKEAENEGVADQVVAGLKAFSVAPIDMVVNALGTSAPAIVAGLVSAPAMLGVGAVMGAGTAKSAIYDATKEILKEKTQMSPQQIEAAAVKAQEYGGENLDQILLSSGIGAFASRTGAEASIVKQITKSIEERAVIKKVQSEAAEAAAKKVAERGAIRQGALTAGKEFATESVQGGQEQFAANLAQQRQGFDTPLMQGVAGQATLEGVAGAGLGAVTGARESMVEQREQQAKTALEEFDKGFGTETETGFKFTSEEGDVPATQRGFTAEDADLLLPSSTQAGAATVEGVTRPEVTEETITPETVAQKYLDDIASGAVKPNASKLKKLTSDLGIEVETGEGFSQRAQEAIAARLKGQQDVTGTIDQTAGEGAGVAGEPGAAGAEGLGTTVDGGVDTTGADTADVTGGEGTQPPAVELEDVPDFTAQTTTAAEAPLPTLTEAMRGSTAINMEAANRLIAIADSFRDGFIPEDLINKTAKELGLEVNEEAKPEETFNRIREAVNQFYAPAIAQVSTEDKAKIDAAKSEITDLMYEGEVKKALQKIRALNSFEEKLGIPKTEFGSTLSARLGKDEIRTPRYEEKNLPEGTQEVFNTAREEFNVEADRQNQIRDGLKRGVEEAQSTFDELTDKLDKLEETITDKDKNTTAYKSYYADLVNQVKAAENNLAAQTDRLKEHGGVQTKIPEWNKLDAVDKDILFENIPSSGANIADYRDALVALRDVRRQTGVEKREVGTAGRSKVETERASSERRLAKNYDDNKRIAGRLLGVTLPSWSELSENAKEAFRSANTVTRQKTGEIAYTMTGEQQDAGFEAVARTVLTEQADRGELSPQVKAQREAILDQRKKEAEQSRKDLKALQERYNRSLEGQQRSSNKQLDRKVIQAIQAGEINNVLDALIEQLKSRGTPVQQLLAKTLRALNLKTRITIASDLLPNNDLAQYDSVTDHIVMSPIGMKPQVLLHEIIHAATVQVMDNYLNNRLNRLTETQIAGAKQIVTIMKAVRPFLVKDFPNAFDNPFEFITYALTDTKMASALGELKVVPDMKQRGKYKVTAGSLADLVLKAPSGENITLESILPKAKTAWGAFKTAIAKIIGVPAGNMKSPNLMMELYAAFEDVLMAPTEPIYIDSGVLPAKRATKADEKKLKTHGKGAKRSEYLPHERHTPNSLKRLARRLFTRQGWQENVRDLQDQTYFTRAWQTTRDKAGQITFDMSGKFTNIADQYDRGMAEGRNYATHFLQEPVNALRTAMADYAEKYKLKIEDALADFHIWAEMFHEPERRRVNFVTRVPLSTDTTGPKGLIHNGKPISAADRRVQILGDQILGTEGLIHRVDLTEDQRKALWKELQFLADNYADADGYGPALTIRGGKLTDAAQKKTIVDQNSEVYNALGVSLEEVADRRKDYDALPEEQRAAIEDIFAKAKAVSDVQAKLDKIGKYWSRPVDNLVGMYDYKHYMPFKGFNEEVERYSDFRTMGADLQEQAFAADGRFSTSENPILQLMSDAYRAAARAGRRNYTQAIKNAAEQKLIPGAIVLPGIPFAERQAKQDIIARFKGAKGSSIFHYDSDGTLYIIQIKNNVNLLNSMRLAFNKNNSLVDIANDITGFFGAMHTRYNYNFAPLNFVRDTLTNAWNIGASGDLGPAEAAKYLRHVSTQVVKNGLGKAWTVARLHESGKPADKAKLKSMAEKDPFVKAMLELIKYGGKTTYLEGFSLKSNLEKLDKGVGNSKVADTAEGFTQFVDSWNYMFEFTSRAAAYELRKESMYKRFIKEGMKPAQADVAAATEAAIWTKNLANFEKTGTYGRNIGALYMFFRPSVTGAVRAAQAALPAFPFSEKFYVDSLPQDIKDDPKLKAKYLENFRKDRKNSRIMVSALMGAGYMAYMMAALMSPDDDWGRNNVKSDNMQQWTRYWRIHLPDGGIVQIPWGFGLGAFAAAGAQLAAAAHGNEPIGDALGNIAFSIMTDAFLPLPISRMSAVDEPASWVVDTIMPTTLRPLVEYVMNKDGLGRTINSTSQRRMGDAYTGGDKINEMYKDAAKYLYRATDGAVDLSPNAVYFFANSYADGIGKIAESLYSFGLLGAGQKEFKAKTDVPFIGSFIGAETNVDSREYGEMEKKIKNIDKRLKSLYGDAPTSYNRFVSNNPTYPDIVSIYKAGQGQLNEVRKQMNEIRGLNNLSPKDRDAILKELQKTQNAIKYGMNRQFKILGLRP
jgi:hypothetical protein